MPVELTERHLNIPRALAAKYDRPGTNRYDELVSAGNEALVIAANNYDASRHPDPSRHLVERVRYAVHNAAVPASAPTSSAARWARLASIDEARGDNASLAETCGDRGAADPSAEAESTDVLRKAMARLGPQERAIYVLFHGKGLSKKDAAERLGVCTDTVRLRLESAQAKLARFAARVGARHRPGPGSTPPRSASQRAASGRHRRERARADRAVGRIPARGNCWYLADDGPRTLTYGPRLTALLSALGLPPALAGRHGEAERARLLAERGVRAVRGPEARRLAEFEDYRLRGGDE